MASCLVGFGSNQGNNRALFDQAVAMLGDNVSIEHLVWSRPIRTEAVLGGEPTSSTHAAATYLNSVLRFDTGLSPEALLECLQDIEAKLGRVREARWAPRTVDLDLLLFGDQVIRTAALTVPHPRMSFRRFVLQGAVEVGATMLHPVIGVSIEDLWSQIQTARKRILWLTDDRDSADQFLDGFLEGVADSDAPAMQGWKCDVVEFNAAEFDAVEFLDLAATGGQTKNVLTVGRPAEEFSLLIFSGPFADFQRAARAFGGPALHLDGDKDFWRREIVAATEARA